MLYSPDKKNFMITDDDVFQGVEEAERRCMRCGRHISELKPFDDPEFSHVKVFPNYRFLNYVETDEKCEEILAAIRDCGESEDLYEFYGAENVRRALVYDERRGWVERCLECKDCLQEEGDFRHYTWKRVERNPEVEE